MIKPKFKQTETDKISKDWAMKKLGDIADFYNGKSSPKRNNLAQWPVFGSNGIIGYADECNSENGTIIIGRVGSYCGSLYYSEEKCWVTDNAIIGKTRKGTNCKFLFYLLMSLGLNRHRGGSGQPLLNQGILNSIEIEIPDKLSIQCAIAKILSDLDSKIELNRQINKTLESIAQAIFKRWFVDFEFPDEKGKPYKSSGGEIKNGIPREWALRKLGDYVNVAKGCSYSSSDLQDSDKALVTLKSIERGGGFKKEGFKEYIGPYKPAQEIQDGDIVVAHTDLTQKAEVLGQPAIVHHVRKYTTLIASLDLSIVRSLNDELNNAFIYFLLKTDDFQNHALGYANGTTVLHLSTKAIPKYEFVLPQKNIVSKFGMIIQPILDKVKINSEETENIILLRDSLLPRLMTGKIRVKV